MAKWWCIKYRGVGREWTTVGKWWLYSFQQDQKITDGVLWQHGFCYLPGNSINYNTRIKLLFKVFSKTSIITIKDCDDKAYVIAGVPSITDQLEVPLELTMGYDGEVTIDIDEWQNVDREVYLLDKYTNETQTLDDGNATLTLDSGVYSDRFAITFVAQETLSFAEQLANSIVASYNKDSNTISISSKGISLEL